MLFHAKRPEPELNPHGHNHNRLNPYRIRLNPADMPATLQLVFAARGLLEQAMNRLMDGQFADTIRDAARLIRRACVLDPDLAIASIILCREGRYSIVHSVGSAIVAERLGRSTGASDTELDVLVASALTMNISIFDIQDQLQHHPDPLTSTQLNLIRDHPAASVRLLQAAGISNAIWLDTVHHHHEAHDGSGYPLGRSHDEIPLFARLVHMSDLYCAKVAPRHYRRAQASAIALRELLLKRGHSVSAHIAAHLLRLIGLYPPGTLVRLANGAIAMVTRTTDHPGEPDVACLVDAESNVYDPPQLCETDDPAYHIIESLDPYTLEAPINPSDLWN